MSAPRPRTGPGARRPFGSTWWGRAWTNALEQQAQLDPNRLPRGRTYARKGRVGALVVAAGEVSTTVLGSRATAYRVRVRVRPFSDDEWDVVIGAIAARAAHAAALLDGELPPEVADDVASAGLDLLPGPGEVGPWCSCPDWANPCKHAAAVCYLVADVLDGDPFALFLLRGRDRDEVLAGLRARRSGAAGGGGHGDGAGSGAVRPDDPGVVAREAFAAVDLHDRPALPRPPLPRAGPGRPAVLGTDPPAAAGVPMDAVMALAADAARRAWELATGAGDGGLSATPEDDLARRADAALGTPAFDSLIDGSGVDGRRLVRLATAWRHGGVEAVAVLDRSADPPAEAIDEVRAVAADAGRGPVRVAGNRVSLAGGGVQLRWGADGRWYRLERRAGGWDVVAPPQADPARLLDGGGGR